MKNEFRSNDIQDEKSHSVDGFKNIKPEKELTNKELNSSVENEILKAANEAKYRITEDSDNKSYDKNIDSTHKDCLTTSEERKEFAERNIGTWDNEIGNSMFHPDKEESREALESYKQDGINYKDGEPDFSKVSEATVEIEKMTSNRPSNFIQANEACAKLWNSQAKYEKTDWTARDVNDWKKENRFSWHERLDMKTMDLVQRDIHEECKHYGGVAECHRHEMLNGGGFDE